jgi:hypothetical protein
MEVKTNEELGKALKDHVEEIEISVETGLGKTVTRIKGTGKIAWAICFSALAVGIVAIIAAPATGGVSAPAGAAFMVAPVAALGLPAATAAIAIAVAGGGAGVLNKLRGYKMEKRDGKVILKRK